MLANISSIPFCVDGPVLGKTCRTFHLVRSAFIAAAPLNVEYMFVTALVSHEASPLPVNNEARAVTVLQDSSTARDFMVPSPSHGSPNAALVTSNVQYVCPTHAFSTIDIVVFASHAAFRTSLFVQLPPGSP